jgi:hypothetical protein
MAIRIIFSTSDDTYLPGNDSTWVKRFKVYVQTGLNFLYSDYENVERVEYEEFFSANTAQKSKNILFFIVSEHSDEGLMKYAGQLVDLQKYYPKVVLVSKSPSSLQAYSLFGADCVLNFSGLYNTGNNLTYLQDVYADGVAKEFVRGILELLSDIYETRAGRAINYENSTYALSPNGLSEIESDILNLLASKGSILRSSLQGDVLASRNIHQEIIRRVKSILIFGSCEKEQWTRMKLMELAKAPGIGRKQSFDKIILIDDCSKSSEIPSFGLEVQKINTKDKKAIDIFEMIV